jgi:hypothetical protein
MFDSLLKDSLATNDVIVVSGHRDEADAYAAATECILQEASQVLANVDLQGRSDADLAAVTIWEGESRGTDDQTAQFRDLASEQGFRIFEVSTLAETGSKT